MRITCKNTKEKKDDNRRFGMKRHNLQVWATLRSVPSNDEATEVRPAPKSNP